MGVDSRALAVALAALAAAALAAAVAISPGAPAVPAAAATPQGANAVAVPYQGTVDVKPAAGWLFSDCAAVLAATPLVVACEPETISLAAPAFDPGFGVARVPVAITNGATALIIDYLFSMEAPTKPELDSFDYDYPMPAGSRVLIPVSDLGIVCTLCGDGVTLEAVSVKPKRAGTVSVTESHLVLRTTPGYSGSAAVRFRAYDDLEQRSQSATVTVHLYPAGDDALVAAHVILPFAGAGEPTEVDLAELVADADGPVDFASGDDADAGADADATVIGCGAAAVGTVLCQPGGSAVYHPAPAGDADVDQFSFHVQRGGEQATGSVTLVRTGGPAAGARSFASGAGTESALSIVPPLAPPAEGGGTVVGLFTPFSRLLDGVGA